MLTTARSAARKSRHSLMNRSTSSGSSTAISAWSIQCVPTPRTCRGHASGLIAPVSVPANSMSVYSSRVCSEGRVIRTPSPTLRFSPALNRPRVAPNCWARRSKSASASRSSTL